MLTKCPYDALLEFCKKSLFLEKKPYFIRLEGKTKIFEDGRVVQFRRHMKPEEGARKQVEIYRKMSGKERLRTFCEMQGKQHAMTRKSERAMNPDLTDDEIEERARNRMTGGTTESH
jgi:hypothetical protein